MPSFEIKHFRGAISDFEDRGIEGAFKFGKNLDVRKKRDTLSAAQAFIDIGDKLVSASQSPSASLSPSASASVSASLSLSPSASASPTQYNISPSSSRSQSPSKSPSASLSPSASSSPSNSMSPSASPTSGLNTVFSDLIRFFVPCSDGNTYGFGNAGKIYKILEDNSVFLVFNQGYEIKGAAEEVANNGKTYLTWATNTEQHRKEIPGRSDWNDVDASTQESSWPKTNLTSADWHTMKQINGTVEIANGSSLALIGYDQSYTNQALDVIPGNYIKTIVERNGRGIYGVYKAGYPNKGVNAAIDIDLPLAQIGDDGELYYSDMNDFLYTKRFPGGGIVNPGGVTAELNSIAFFEWDGASLSYIDKQSIANLSLWGVYNADTGYNGLYSYGRKSKNHPVTLNLDYALEVDEIGAVICNNGHKYISYRDGSDYGVKVEDPTTKATGHYYSLDLKSPVKKPADITNWTMAEVLCDPLPENCSIEVWYRLDRGKESSGEFVRAKTLAGETSFSTANGIKSLFSIQGKGEVFEAYIKINTYLNNSPEITSLRFNFD